ncbi:MAB_1171c family putative transporter [Nonomuraea sp. JJY05]|uniref:MAB_1171c family putative transporter n=1 Tax=Nonomuraea sp. JJY05 TaxID=3350255 RepID=UPI00373FA0AD
MGGWLWTIAAWVAVAARLRQTATLQDRGLLAIVIGMASTLTLARPEVAAFVDAGGMPISSLAKRCVAMVGVFGIVLYMSGVAGRSARKSVLVTLGAVAVLVATYLAGAWQWPETTVFYAYQDRFELTPAMAMGWLHWITWYGYVALILLALAATCVTAAREASGIVRTQLILFIVGAVWCALSPAYCLTALAGLLPYRLLVDQAAFLAPGMLIIILAMAFQQIQRRRAGTRSWLLYQRLKPLWKLLLAADPKVPVLHLGGLWRIRLQRQVSECHDAMRRMWAYLPPGTYEAGRVDPGATALRLRDAIAAKEAGSRAERTAKGTPVNAGTEIAEEAKWLISVWKAWKKLEARQDVAEVSPAR